MRIGATPEELTALKGVFDAQAGKVDELVAAVNSKLGAVDWQGPAHDKFQNLWETQFKTALRNLQESLRAAGNEAQRVGENIRIAGTS